MPPPSKPAGSSDSSDARQTHPLALLAVSASVTMWGLSNTALKYAGAPPLVKSLYRLWFAVPFLWGIALLTPSIRQSIDRRWLTASLIGGILFALHQIFFFTALQATSVANLTIVAALQPALVIFLAAYIFHEPVSWKALPWLFGAFVGVGVVIFGTATTPGGTPVGDALAVANLFAFTTYFLFSKHIRASVAAAAYTIGMSTVAAVVLTATVLVTHGEIPPIAASDAWILLAVALVPGTLGHMLMNWVHPYASAFVVSTMILAVPIIASASAAFFLGEALAFVQIAGGAIALSSVGIVVYLSVPD